MKYMTRHEFADNFAKNLEKERINLDLTQEEFATKLDLSLSTYKRIANRETTKIDAYTTYLMYLLTQKLCYELVDYSDALVDTMSLLRELSHEELAFTKQFIELILRYRKDED